MTDKERKGDKGGVTVRGAGCRSVLQLRKTGTESRSAGSREVSVQAQGEQKTRLGLWGRRGGDPAALVTDRQHLHTTAELTQQQALSLPVICIYA